MVELITLIIGVFMGSGIAYFSIKFGIKTQSDISNQVQEIVNPNLNTSREENSNTDIEEDTNYDWDEYPYTNEYTKDDETELN